MLYLESIDDQVETIETEEEALEKSYNKRITDYEFFQSEIDRITSAGVDATMDLFK